MKITQYTIISSRITERLSLACVADLHGRDPKRVVSTLLSMKPDAILLAGDIFEVANQHMRYRNENSMNFLKAIRGIAPVFYCFGNHEVFYSHSSKEEFCRPDPILQKDIEKSIRDLGIILVNNIEETISLKENTLSIAGLVCGYDTDPSIQSYAPDLSTVRDLEHSSGFRILLCHYPHYYEKYLKDAHLDLILSGHAHGGHWRIFGRGVYAPHQGLFPKYTSGIYDGRFIINRGAVNNSRPIPRFFNPTEVVEIILQGDMSDRRN